MEPQLAAVIEQERTRLVMECCVRSLTRRQFQVLTLIYHHGLSQVEVAALFDVTKVAVCRMHSRALRALRAELASRKVFALWQI
jgi:RNA polymerase sigma factor (sigma-70 family)